MVNLQDLNQIEFKRMVDVTDFIEYTREINTIGETKNSREWWTISAYSHYNLINGIYGLPLTICRGTTPKPDFWISFKDNVNNLGIETTFCSEQKYEQAKKICKKRNDGSYPINTAFMKNNIGNFDENSFQLPNQPLHGMPIYGNYSKDYTLDRIIKSITKKIETYVDFKNKYILAVYVNLPSNIYIDNAKKLEICKSLSTHKEWSNTFITINIIWSKDTVFKLDITDNSNDKQDKY